MKNENILSELAEPAMASFDRDDLIVQVVFAGECCPSEF